MTVAPNGTAAIALVMNQTVAPTPFQNTVPFIDGMVASSGTPAVNDTIALSVAAHDVDPGDTLTYAWTASAGVVTPNGDGTAAAWTAPAAAGDYAITALVTDSKGSTSAMTMTAKVNAGRGAAAVQAQFNMAPVVNRIVANPARLDAGQTASIVLDAVDAEGDAMTYAWTSTCNGTFTTSTSRNPTYRLTTVPASKQCDLKVTVTDARGAANTGKLTIKAGPAPAIDLAPTIDSTFQSVSATHAGYPVTLRVQAHDPNNGPVTFAWAAGAGALGTPTTTANSSEVRWNAPGCAASPPPWTIGATVTDSTGNVTPVSFSVGVAAGGCDFESGTLLVAAQHADGTPFVAQLDRSGNALRELGAQPAALNPRAHLAMFGGLLYRSNGNDFPVGTIEALDASGALVRSFAVDTSANHYVLPIIEDHHRISLLFMDVFDSPNVVHRINDLATGASTFFAQMPGVQVQDLFRRGDTVYALNLEPPPATSWISSITTAGAVFSSTTPDLVLPYESDVGAIVSDSLGNIYVATSSTIVKANGGQTQATFGGAAVKPSLGIDASDRLYYGHFDSDTIDVLETSGAAVSTIHVPNAVRIVDVLVVP